MTFELIAHFYEKCTDTVARYRVPIGFTDYEKRSEILNSGFREIPGSEYDFMKEVTEPELQDLTTDEECIPELLDVLNCGLDYEKIVVKAFEVEFLDGEPWPRGFQRGKVCVTFKGSGNDGEVVFFTPDESFSRPLTSLKARLGAMTMFEVFDSIKAELSNREAGTVDLDLCRQLYGASLDDAILLAVNIFHNQFDLDGKPAVLHSLEVGRNGETEDEQIVGYLHDVVEDSATTFDDLLSMGYTKTVVDTLRLVTHDKSEMTYTEYVRRIAESGNMAAIHVKLNDLRHNLGRGTQSYEHAASAGDSERMAAFERINAKHRKALEYLEERINGRN